MRKPILTPMENFRNRVARWSRQLRAQPRTVMVMRMTRKWASCSPRGRVCFARDLLDLSPALQDYVIAHELLHMRHPNHGRVFHALLTAHIPKWRRHHARLRARVVMPN
jgi:hypothetical protein